MKKEPSFLLKVAYVLSIIVAFYFFLPESTMGRKTANKDEINVIDSVTYNSVPKELISSRVISTFIGELTGYGPDCLGCSGITKYGYNVTNGNIYYYDQAYGKVRIVAADPKYKAGTIVRITAPKVLEKPVIAIVLDRGGGIKGDHLDLLYENEDETKVVGKQKSVTFEVLRNGW